MSRFLPLARRSCPLDNRSRGLCAAATGIALCLAVATPAADQNGAMRELVGRHLVLLTDLPPSTEVDELPAVFDRAVPQWADYFQVDPQRVDGWQLRGYLMFDRERFRAAGRLPDDLPPFQHGYQRGDELWLNEQPTAYYRRHLLLHEGTHGFMNAFLGGCGPPWYMEGVAELLATHRWQTQRLELGYFPRSKEEVPYWGRIKIIQNERAAGRTMTLAEVLRYDHQAHQQLAPYAWCWAAAALLDGDPRFQARFRNLRHDVGDRSPEFSQRFLERFRDDAPQLLEQWQLMAAEIDYGYDVARAAIEYQPARPLPAEGATIELRADRGWQSTGLVLEPSAAYRLAASGRYQVADQPRSWWCEPQGVTIQYVQGRPLGMLLAAVREEPPLPHTTSLASPQPVGREAALRPERAGVLFLRINEHPRGLADNAGTLRVLVTRSAERPSAATDPD